MAEETGNVTLEQGTGGSQGSNAHTEGMTYEAITDQLKRGESGAEPEAAEVEETPAPAPEAPADPAPTAEDEFRTMTDAEIAALPPELQKEARALRKHFQAAYTRKTQGLAEIRKRADTYQRFETDPTFQAEVYRQLSQRFGGHAPAGQPQQPQAQTVPPEYVEMRRKTLPPEMQWMAESLAQGDYQRDQMFQQRFLTPLQKQQQQERMEKAQASYRAAEEELTASVPAWQEHEDDMAELVEYLKSPALTHPRFGNKLALLYETARRVLKPAETQAAVVQAAVQRTAQAAQAASVTARGSARSTAPNLEERIRSAPNDEAAWEQIRKANAGR